MIFQSIKSQWATNVAVTRQPTVRVVRPARPVPVITFLAMVLTMLQFSICILLGNIFSLFCCLVACRYVKMVSAAEYCPNFTHVGSITATVEPVYRGHICHQKSGCYRAVACIYRLNCTLQNDWGLTNLAAIQTLPVCIYRLNVHYRSFWDSVTWLLYRSYLPTQWPLNTSYNVFIPCYTWTYIRTYVRTYTMCLQVWSKVHVRLPCFETPVPTFEYKNPYAVLHIFTQNFKNEILYTVGFHYSATICMEKNCRSMSLVYIPIHIQKWIYAQKGWRIQGLLDEALAE